MRRDPACDCGDAYADFRTGLTFAQVQAMLWTASEHRRGWKHKRRNTVLGRWRSIKLSMFREAHSRCP